MQKYIAFNLYTLKQGGGHHPVGEQRKAKDVYLASDVDARIAELAKVFARWLPPEIVKDVTSPGMPDTAGFNGQYLNDLADMRAAYFLMESGS
jgi:hypothetical protein